MSVIELSNENFDKEVKQSDLPIIVDFFATWCGPCQMMGPVFEELSEEMKDKVKFAKVNTENNAQLSQTYAIRSIPCFIVFKGGEEVERIIGGMPKDALKEKLESLM